MGRVVTFAIQPEEIEAILAAYRARAGGDDAAAMREMALDLYIAEAAAQAAVSAGYVRRPPPTPPAPEPPPPAVLVRGEVGAPREDLPKPYGGGFA